MAVRGDVKLRVQIDGENKANAAIDSAERRLGKLDKTTGRLEKTSKKSGKGIKGLAGGLSKVHVAAAAAFAAIAAGRAALAVLDKLAEKGDKIAKSAPGIGLTAQQYQELDFALKISGGSMDESASAFAKLSRVIRDSSQGSKAATQKLGQLGISATDASGAARNTFEVFLEITDAMKDMTNETERTAVALDFFEESGFKLIPFLKQGSDGIKRLSAEAHSVGAVLSSETIKATEEYKDAQLRLESATDGLIAQFGTPFLNAIAGVANALSGVSREGVDPVIRDFHQLRVESGKAVDEMARSTERAVNRVLDALRAQSQGLAGSIEVAGIAAQFTSQIAAVKAQAMGELASLQKRVAEATERGLDLGTVETLEAKVRKLQNSTKARVDQLKKAAESAMAGVVDTGKLRVQALDEERLKMQGLSDTQIALRKEQAKESIAATAFKKLEAEAEKVKTAESFAQAAAAQNELELTKASVNDLLEVVKLEKKRTGSVKKRSVSSRVAAVSLADQLNLMRSIAEADGEVTAIERVRLASKEKEVAIDAIATKLAEKKMTAERASLLVAIEENKERGKLAKIQKSAASEREASIKRERELAKSMLDDFAGRSGAVSLAVAFDPENLFANISTAFGGLSARLNAEGERLIADAIFSGAITEAEGQIARETVLVEARLGLLEKLGSGLADAGLAASQSADITVAAVGRMSAAIGAQAGNIAKGGASAISAAGKVAAATTESAKKQALIQGAFETAAGFASLAKPDPVGAGLHFTSAGLFFALAATGEKSTNASAVAGGGGIGGGPGQAEAITTEAGGGVAATTVIFNAPVIAGNSQEAAQQISDVMSGNAGTGMQGGSV